MKTLFLYIVDDKNAPILAGLSAVEWLKRGAGDLPHKALCAEAPLEKPQTDYFAVLTPSTPLVTAEHLKFLICEMEKRGYAGLEIGRGMLVKTAAYYEGFHPKRRANFPFAAVAEEGQNLALAEKTLYRRIAELSAQNGAIIPDVETVRIDALSTLEAGVTVEPYATVKNSKAECGAVIGSFSEVENARIGRNAKVLRSVVKDSEIEAGATVGPFAYVRMQSVVGEGCRIGDFVEIKRSRLGKGVKAAHLAYVGDAVVGEGTNVGCGVVFANYDGKQKHATTVGKNVFIGANTNLVAPVTVGDGAYVAAATTVTRDVTEGAFVIGRSRAEQKQKK